MAKEVLCAEENDTIWKYRFKQKKQRALEIVYVSKHKTFLLILKNIFKNERGSSSFPATLIVHFLEWTIYSTRTHDTGRPALDSRK